MANPHPPTIPDKNFFQVLAKSSRRLLILDYDGTLSPGVKDGLKTHPYPGIKERLQSLQALPKLRTVIMTGRPLSEILPLLSLKTAPEIWGSHGWQHLRADGALVNFPLPEELDTILKTVAEQFKLTISLDQLDIKPASVAVHWKGLPENKKLNCEQLVHAVFQPYGNHPGLDVQAFEGGMELRVKGRDKGAAVSAFLTETGANTFAAYLGDDRTDEDAFGALAGKGHGILVCTEVRPTQATWWIKPPEELLSFLDQWQAACKG